jgi:hypothetical protein
MWADWFTIHPERRFAPGAPVTARWANERHLDLFATGDDGAVCSAWWEPDRGWQPWFAIHPERRFAPGAPVTARWANERHLDLFATGDDGAVCSAWWEPKPSPDWGLLANAPVLKQRVKGVFFFAGSSRDQPQAYEYPTAPNEKWYTVHPLDDRHLRWSSDTQNRSLVIDMLMEAGVNTLMMSFWGERGADRWAYWAPMQTSTYAHDELLTALVDRDIYFVPVIEAGDATYPNGGHSPAYHFRDEYVGDQGPDVSACPYLEYQVEDLVRRYLLGPENQEWRTRWARLYDREGIGRYAVMLMHVASNKLAPGEDDRFAAGFDRIAEAIGRRTGVLVGFTLDILPPAGDSWRYFYPSAEGTGAALERTTAVLGVQAFIPEIYLNSSDEPRLLAFKKDFAKAWCETGVPVIFDATVGYHATIFGSSPRYGNNDWWRNSLRTILHELPVKGVYVECWNGYTEGYSAAPTHEFGDANYLWLEAL